MERLDKRQARQQRANTFALYPFALAVDQANDRQAGFATLDEIFFDDTADFFGVERMEIKHIFEG